MPIYEYVCPSCKNKFEVLRPLSQSGEAAVCPKCHQKAERVLSRFACFSAGEGGGEPVPVSGAGGGCASCGGGSCASCGM